MLEQLRFDEPLGGDQQRIPGERRHATVWRVSIAGRIERQDLPHSHPRLRDPVEKLDQLVAENADAVAAGKRRRMKENAGDALRFALGGHYSRASGLTDSFSPSASNSSSHRALVPLFSVAAMAGRTVDIIR